MILALTAVTLLSLLLATLFLRAQRGHTGECLASSYSSCSDLSVALREVCRGVLAAKTIMFLTANAPAEVITSFGSEQQRLARYSLRVVSDTLVRSLAGGPFRSQASEARRLFLLAVCTVGRIGLGVLRSVNWGVPRSVQASISATVLMSFGKCLDESTLVADQRLQEGTTKQTEKYRAPFISARPYGESGLDKQVHEALLKALPNDLSRMIYVATLRDNNSGHYYYPELTQRFSAEIVDRAMLACHGQLFDRVVQLSLEDLTESLDVYMAGTHIPKTRVIQSWKKLRAYRATIPIDSDPISAEVFFMKVDVAVAILGARLPVDSYGLE